MHKQSKNWSGVQYPLKWPEFTFNLSKGLEYTLGGPVLMESFLALASMIGYLFSSFLKHHFHGEKYKKLHCANVWLFLYSYIINFVFLSMYKNSVALV